MASALLMPMKDKLDRFSAFSPSGKSSQKLAQKMNGNFVKEINSNALENDFIFLSFKPQQFSEASSDFMKASSWNGDEQTPLLISMLAGTPMEVLTKTFKSNNVVRIMPNTPCLTGSGVILVFFHSSVAQTIREQIVGL